MAKGRKLTTSRSERYLGTNYTYNNPAPGTLNGSSELREEDVWSTSMLDDDSDDYSTNGGEWTPRASLNNNYMTRHPLPRADRQTTGGLSLAFHDTSSNSSSSPRIVHQFRTQESVTESPRGRHMATSAPVNVPDWSKIYRVDSVDSLHDSAGYVDDDHDSELVPPHEYLAREYSRKTAANSVFEGVGRTLKGRDLSRVRDAVWSQTGFDG